MKTRLARSFFLSVAITSLNPAHSADANAGDRNYAFIEEAFTDSLDLPMVLTPSRMATPIHESPSAVTVIDRELIRASGATSVVEVLRFVPGMSVFYEDDWKAGVRYHGPSDNGSARHVQVLVDGRSVYQPGYAQVYWDWMGVNLNEVERIEVVRGPSNATHGVNAFSGTIHIITRHAQDTLGSNLALLTTDYDRAAVHAQHGASFANGDGAWRIDVDLENKEGFDKTYNHARTALIENNDSSQLRNINYRLDFSPNLDNDFSFHVGLLRGKVDQGEIGYDPAPPHTLEVESRYLNTSLLHRVDEHATWKLRFSHQEMDQENPWFATYSTGGITLTGFLNDDRFEKMTELSAQYENRWTPTLRTITGLDLRRDQVRGETWFGHNDWISSWRKHVFINSEFSLEEATKLHIGIAADHVAHLHRTDWTHNVALTHSPTANQGLRVGWGHAVRVPDLYESKANWSYTLTNPFTYSDQYGLASADVVPEKIESFELGWNATGLWNTLDTDLRIFQNRSTNLIDTTTDYGVADPYKTYTNQDWSRHRGYELMLDWQATAKTRLRGNYSHVFHLSSNNPLLEESLPRDIGSLLLVQTLGSGYEASAAFHFLGSYDGTNHLPEHPYRRYDLRLSKSTQVGSTPLTWTLLWQHQRDLTTPENGNNISDDHGRLTGILEFKF
jgi:iron complex outermembrane receptor protein